MLLSQGSFEECLAKEKMYELYSDSDSVEEANKIKAFKRRHPVNSQTSGLFNLSSDFEATTGIA